MSCGSIDLGPHFKTTLSNDLRRMLIGDRLGFGAHRDVYEHASDPSLVVKLEGVAKSFQNVSEWQVWESVKHTGLAEWFAPCVDISPAGLILTMVKARPMEPCQLPSEVPAFFTDVKAENWGFLDGRPVCIDYGLHLLIEKGMTNRMRKVQWDR